MNFIVPKVELMTELNREEILKKIELAGRTCYKSEEKITKDSAKLFVSGVVRRGHLSVIEHVNVSVRFFCDRGVTHEIVRHRIASYSQESTRFCNYKNMGMNFIEMKNHFKNPKSIEIWLNTLEIIEKNYNMLLENGETLQIARSILPNCLKTEIVVTANLREWMHIFKERTQPAAHPQMREIMIPLLKQFKEVLPEIYGGIDE